MSDQTEIMIPLLSQHLYSLILPIISLPPLSLVTGDPNPYSLWHSFPPPECHVGAMACSSGCLSLQCWRRAQRTDGGASRAVGIVSFFVLDWITSRNYSWKKNGKKKKYELSICSFRLINLLLVKKEIYIYALIQAAAKAVMLSVMLHHSDFTNNSEYQFVVIGN